MQELTSWERFQRMYEHRDADRIPIIDDPWAATIERWRREEARERTKRRRPDLLTARGGEQR